MSTIFLIGAELLRVVGIGPAIDAGTRPLTLLLGVALAACAFTTEGLLRHRPGSAGSVSIH